MSLFNKKIRDIPVIPVLLLALCYTWQTWLVKGNCFFWDTVQFGSLHGHWYFENQFRELLLPDKWDSGHPPVFGMYIAACWTIFGKSLITSHFAMLPWLLLALWQMVLLTRKLTQDIYFRGATLILLIVNPVWSSQATLISPDIILGACFLGAINGILHKNRWIIFIFGIGISLISNRGLMISLSLFLSAQFYHNGWRIELKKLVNTILPFTGGWALAIAYMIYHYIQKGWIGYYEGSSWNESFVRVDSMGLLKNVLVYGWRLVDFGHLGLWLILIFVLVKNRNRILQLQDSPLRFFLILGFSLILFFGILVLPYQGLLGHRYFLPIYWILSILVMQVLMRYVDKKNVKKWIFIATTSMISGNFWVYPQPIATGWDSTLAHLSYYKVREEMINFMIDVKIPISQTGTAFPNQLSAEYIDLKPEAFTFAEKNLEQNQYVFYSNVMNDFTPAELTELRTKWREIKSFKQGFVFVKLYKNEQKTGHLGTSSTR